MTLFYVMPFPLPALSTHAAWYVALTGARSLWRSFRAILVFFHGSFHTVLTDLTSNFLLYTFAFSGKAVGVMARQNFESPPGLWATEEGYTIHKTI